MVRPLNEIGRLVEAMKDLDESERRKRLERLRQTDPETAEEVASLLPFAESSNRFLESPIEDRVVLGGDRNAPEPQDPVAVGTKVGEFTILERIGQGGMGAVYRARQESTGRDVALKFLHSYRGSAADFRRFKSETSLLATLDHPGIVRVITVDHYVRPPYFAMDLIDGRPLDEILSAVSKRSPDSMDGLAFFRAIESAGESEDLPEFWRHSYEDIVCRLCLQIVDALDYAHRQEVLHRDIKPANIIVKADGRIFLTDFGLARLADTKSAAITQEMVGTLGYMPPEQVNEGRIDRRSDLYSLGITLYELLTLKRPYEATTRRELANLIASPSPPPSPRKVRRGLSRDLESLCLKAMEKGLDARYQDAKELADDLNAFLGRFPVKARRPGRVTRTLRLVQRHPALSLLTAALLVVVLSFVWMQKQALDTKGRLNGELNEVNATLRTRNFELAETNSSLEQANEDLHRANRRIEEERLATELEAEKARVASANQAWNLARLAARRGEWHEALAHYKAAEDFGYEDGIGIELERIVAHQSLFRDDDVRRILDSLRKKTKEELGIHQVRVLMLEGLFRANREGARENGEDLIRQAIERAKAEPEKDWLSEPELAYAEAYVSSDVVSLKSRLEYTLELDPGHRSARVTLVGVLNLLGMVEEAAEHAWILRNLQPDDDTAIFLHCFALLLRKETREEGRALIEDLRSRGHAECVASCQMISQHAIEFDESGTSWIDTLLQIEESEGSIPFEFDLNTALYLRAIKDALSPKSGLDLIVPPAIDAVAKTAVATTFSVLSSNLRNPDSVAQERAFQDLIATYPCGFVFFLRGAMRLMVNDYPGAHRDFVMAERLPTPLSLGEAPLFYRMECQLRLYLQFIKNDRSRAGKAREELIELFERFGSKTDRRPEEWRYAFQAAETIQEIDYEEEFSFRWIREDPDDLNALTSRAKVALDRGAYVLAAKIATEVLDVDPDDQEAGQVLDQANESLGR